MKVESNLFYMGLEDINKVAVEYDATLSREEGRDTCEIELISIVPEGSDIDIKDILRHETIEHVIDEAVYHVSPG